MDENARKIRNFAEELKKIAENPAQPAGLEGVALAAFVLGAAELFEEDPVKREENRDIARAISGDRAAVSRVVGRLAAQGPPK